MQLSRRTIRAVAAGAVVALSTVGLVAAAGPATAAAGCDQATHWSSPATSWDISWLDTDGRQDVAVWRTSMFRASGCRNAEAYWAGWTNTAEESARMRVRTYYENGDLRVDSGWRTVRHHGYPVLRTNVNRGVRIRFDVYHPNSGRWSGLYPPDSWTYVVF